MTTRTYQEIQDQIAALEKEAKEARARGLASARSEINAILTKHGLTMDELAGSNSGGNSGGGGGRAVRKRAVRGPSVPKFRDPETGATWSGMGRTPNWAKGKNLDELRI